MNTILTRKSQNKTAPSIPARKPIDLYYTASYLLTGFREDWRWCWLEELLGIKHRATQVEWLRFYTSSVWGTCVCGSEARKHDAVKKNICFWSLNTTTGHTRHTHPKKKETKVRSANLLFLGALSHELTFFGKVVPVHECPNWNLKNETAWIERVVGSEPYRSFALKIEFTNNSFFVLLCSSENYFVWLATLKISKTHTHTHKPVSQEFRPQQFLLLSCFCRAFVVLLSCCCRAFAMLLPCDVVAAIFGM